MKAIILAAGLGTRLGKYTKDMPKCMLNFNGKPLIEWQLETLKKAGISDIVIIKGYKPEKIAIPNVKYYINEDYDVTNMVDTLFAAENELDSDTLILYSDILYELKLIKKVIESRKDIGVTVDSNYLEYWKERHDNLNEDTESLVIKNGKIIELGETGCNIEKAKYRYVGILKFSGKGCEILKKVYKKNKQLYFDKETPWLRSKSFKKAYMTCMLQSIINEGYNVMPIKIEKGWLEFDSVKDYEKYTSWLKEKKLDRFFSFS